MNTISPRLRAGRRLLAGLACAGAAALGLVAATTADAATAPSGEVYVANFNGGTVSQLGTISTGVAHALAYPTVPGGARPSHVIVSPNGKFAYALDCSNGQVLQYAVDTAGLLAGALVPLSPAGSSFGGCLAASSEPTGHGLAENKTGKFIFVPAVLGGPGGLNTLLDFSVATNGTLGQAHYAEIQSEDPNSIAVAPSGKFVYVGDEEGLIFEYAVSTTGVLTEGSLFSADACLADLAFAPSGKNLYAVNNCTNRLTDFTVDATTGALTSPIEVPAQSGASAVAIAPNAKTLYVANATSNTVSQYSVGKTGVPAPLSPAAVGVGVHPLDVAVSPTSKNVYVSNNTSGSVSEFAIGSGNLLLTPIGTVAAGPGAWGIAVRK